MPLLPALIGISVHEKEYCYLSWTPSESGPLIIDYGKVKKKGIEIPFNYFVEKIKEYNVSPQFTIALNNQYVKYNFSNSFNDFVDKWNDDKIYDEDFLSCYESYNYDISKGQFNIHILKSFKENIVQQINNNKYSLTNINVGIFSALSGVNCWYNIENISNYIVLKLSRNNMFELVAIRDKQFLAYVRAKKKGNMINVIDFFGDLSFKNSITELIKSLFISKLDMQDYQNIFYYSTDAKKDNINSIISLNNNNLELINPFKRLKFDDNCNFKLSDVNASSYSELGNAFGGVDV